MQDEEPLTRLMGSNLPGSRFSAAFPLRRLSVMLVLASLLPGIRPELHSRHPAWQNGEQRCLHSDRGSVVSTSLAWPPAGAPERILLPWLPGIPAPQPRALEADARRNTFALIDVSFAARCCAASTRVRGPPDFRALPT